MKNYSVEEKVKSQKWVQQDAGRDTSGNLIKIWKIHYIKHDTEYSVGNFFTKKEAELELKNY